MRVGQVFNFQRVNKPGDESVYHSVKRNHLETKGKIIGNMDMMIAAHALSISATIVTNNIRHFKMVPKLKIENWMQ